MDSSYRTPSRPIADLVDAAPTPSASLSPDRRWLLLIKQRLLPSIAEVAQPELRLAGMRISPRTNGPSRQGAMGAGLTLLDLETRERRAISGLPDDVRLGDLSWSSRGDELAFTVTTSDDVELWIADLGTARARRVLVGLNAMVGKPYSWLSDGTMIARCKVAGRGPAPEKDPVPPGPLVEENDGRKRPGRPNPDLLRGPHDEALFDHYLQAQLVRLTLPDQVEPIGAPATFRQVVPSPDARHLLVAVVHRPYSTKVSVSRFPYRVEIWTLGGAVETTLADLPLMEEVPVDFSAVPVGPRGFEWRADVDATICWTEARDGGDPKQAAVIRDEVLALAAPFDGPPVRLAALALRHGGTTWMNGQLALVTESWWADRKTRTWIIRPDEPTTPPRLLWDRSFEDRYSDPGRPVMRRSGRGGWLILEAPGGAIFLDGEGASPEGDRPFLDRLSLADLTTTRVWQSEAPYYETILDLLDDGAGTLLTWRESVTEPPQYFLRRGAELTRLTDFPHPHPALATVEKKLLSYTRDDGVKLSAMLYLPPGFVPGRDPPLPVLLWAYPQEYKTREAAGQVQESPYRFVRAGYFGPLFALYLGFAVLDDPTFPILGEGTVEPNDSYTPQLLAGARAALDEVVRLGIGDRERAAIGGHSYGAFTAVNLLAHSRIFRAAIARSGAYNRTLTPFGFQSEERTLWQAATTYIDMSPFVHAEKIRDPVLLIHGEVDENAGTYPVQSERLYEAMRGLGGKVRWVVLPAETHAYKARESVLHMLWEMETWLDRHVKNAPPREA